jgi:sugar phosphate isomerase/epimerase
MDRTRRAFTRNLMALAVTSRFCHLKTKLASLSVLFASSKAKFKLGIGTYTFRSLTPAEMVNWLKQMKVEYIELSHPQFMLPQAKREDFPGLASVLKGGGIGVISWYCGDLKQPDEVRRVVEMAKLLEVKHVSGSASGNILKTVDETFQQNGLFFGIHNHWFENRQFEYQSPDDILKALSKTSTHVGATLDTGHMVSCGYDPIDAFLKLKDRIRVMHLKDIEAPGDDQNVIFGTGKGKTDEVLRTIIKEGYAGLVAIEYEKEGPNLRADVKRCVDFVTERS